MKIMVHLCLTSAASDIEMVGGQNSEVHDAQAAQACAVLIYYNCILLYNFF